MQGSKLLGSFLKLFWQFIKGTSAVMNVISVVHMNDPI